MSWTIPKQLNTRVIKLSIIVLFKCFYRIHINKQVSYAGAPYWLRLSSANWKADSSVPSCHVYQFYCGVFSSEPLVNCALIVFCDTYSFGYVRSTAVSFCRVPSSESLLCVIINYIMCGIDFGVCILIFLLCRVLSSEPLVHIIINFILGRTDIGDYIPMFSLCRALSSEPLKFIVNFILCCIKFSLSTRLWGVLSSESHFVCICICCNLLSLVGTIELPNRTWWVLSRESSFGLFCIKCNFPPLVGKTGTLKNLWWECTHAPLTFLYPVCCIFLYLDVKVNIYAPEPVYGRFQFR